VALPERIRDELASEFEISPADVDYWADRVAADLKLGAPRMDVELQDRYGWAAGEPGKAGLFINALIAALRP
jgi:hypothetical protein